MFLVFFFEFLLCYFHSLNAHDGCPLASHTDTFLAKSSIVLTFCVRMFLSHVKRSCGHTYTFYGWRSGAETRQADGPLSFFFFSVSTSSTFLLMASLCSFADSGLTSLSFFSLAPNLRAFSLFPSGSKCSQIVWRLQTWSWSVPRPCEGVCFCIFSPCATVKLGAAF